uniref:adhesion G protein-coupled receptor L4 isoform X2 n=1 Tax=Ciona intestinalis TaxID=7719 RepID=UPI00089DAB8E|nr:adhesion G protein-coupled receptor L4 isoform X2 [Ciona intestinalis]|eukprot:XP_018671878.1 adhesion G protein-coupled receptor L4 isoform X2 [Ciona intestinalis]
MRFVCLVFVLMIVQVVEGTSCSSCDVLATCFSLLIDHYCKCNQGYIGSGITCSDFDECSARPSRCHVNANCSNSIGSYSCACAVGYQGDGVNYCDALPDSITIPVTSTTSELMTSSSLAPTTSSNLNPTTSSTSKPTTSSTLKPTTSSTLKPTTSSIKDNERFTTTGVSNECTTLPAKCHVNAECSNSIGSYKCTCKPGYYGDGVTSCRGYCDEANVTIDDKILHFPQTWVDVETMSSNKCSNGRPLASIYCRKITSLSPNFDASTAVFVSCDVTIHNLTTKIDWKNLESESDKLRLMTSHLTMLTSSVVENVIGFLDDVSYAAKANNTIVSPNTLINIVETSDVISGSLNHSTVTNVVQSLHTIATYVTLDEGESQVQVATSNVAVKVSQSDFNISDVSYHPVFPQTTGISLSPVDVMLPAEVYEQAMNDVTHSDVTPVRTIFIVHHDPDATNTSGWIVTASVSDVTISNLSRPVTYTINAINSTNQKRAIPESLMVLETHLKCVYLDDNGDWSDVGLCRIRGTTTCQSNHLTSFSIIISHTKVHGDVTLSIISTIGCVTSIVCLVITIILHLHNKKLRSLRPTKIFLNVTSNLALFYVIFTMGVSRTDNDDVCTAVAMTMHYVILVTWMWMVVYSFNIYTAVAMMFSKEMTILQAAIFAYLLPVAIVGATSGASIAFPTSLPVDEDRFCDSSPPTIYENFTRTYRSQDKCWIHEGALLYGFLLPVGVCYVTCVILFIMTMQKILKKQVKKKKRSYHRERYIAVTMATMFGVTWVFGYVILVVNDPLSKSVTSWLFAVTSSIQGVMIFILMGWRKPEFRQLFPSLSLKGVGATMRGLVGKKGGYDVNNSFITSAADIAVTATDGDVTNTTVVSETGVVIKGRSAMFGTIRVKRSRD